MEAEHTALVGMEVFVFACVHAHAHVYVSAYERLRLSLHLCVCRREHIDTVSMTQCGSSDRRVPFPHTV